MAVRMARICPPTHDPETRTIKKAAGSVQPPDLDVATCRPGVSEAEAKDYFFFAFLTFFFTFFVFFATV